MRQGLVVVSTGSPRPSVALAKKRADCGPLAALIAGQWIGGNATATSRQPRTARKHQAVSV